MASEHSINNGQAALSYILVDYENVRPKDYDLIRENGWRVMIFLGVAQFPDDAFLQAKERLGEDFSYLRVTRAAKNAVDFHIAYFLGFLSDVHPFDSFYVVSKDKGYDPLIEYVTQRKNIQAFRVEQISEIAELRAVEEACAK